MIIQDFHIAKLIALYLSGEIAPEEEQKLRCWREESSGNEELFNRICDTGNFIDYYKKAQIIDSRKEWKYLERRIRSGRRRNILFKIGKYAAILLLPFIITVWLTDTLSLFKKNGTEQTEYQNMPILPGGKKAILTLDNGESINLDSTVLDYQLAQASSKVEKEVHNRVDVPQGGEYSLTLSDGTKVYLNSMSSMVFPVQFVGTKRVVELSGEAYFEVAKSKKPFIVRINQVEVEVLGTTFNVSAYQGYDFQATLVEGSVKIQTESGANCILKPSEQASIKPGTDDLNIRIVDTSHYTAWVNGKIYFKDERLEDIMNSLARWYDLSVSYTDPGIRELRFGCNVNRYKEITPFLELLEETEKISIELKGNMITFKYKN